MGSRPVRFIPRRMKVIGGEGKVEPKWRGYISYLGYFVHLSWYYECLFRGVLDLTEKISLLKVFRNFCYTKVARFC